MEKRQELIKTIQTLCRKALDGIINLEEFFHSWPEEANLDPFFKQVHEDMEDAIEHQPGFIFKKGVDYESWQGSNAYFILYLDLTLLYYDRISNELLQCRERVLASKKLSEETIRNKVKEYFGC